MFYGIIINGNRVICGTATGQSSIGNNCKIGKNASIKNSILYDDVVVEENVIIENSVVASNSFIERGSIIRNSVIGEGEKIKGNIEGEKIWSKEIPKGYPKKQIGNVVKN